ncbi:thialysine N-epsilon-acetyltransferase-like [Caretta caretta]|uniref:thialysine N-epsilon-acetyltransferase-like n=1 Tax=Caretta caretta TaxID=8467 RepID=UPI003F4B7DC7
MGAGQCLDARLTCPLAAGRGLSGGRCSAQSEVFDSIGCSLCHAPPQRWAHLGAGRGVPRSPAAPPQRWAHLGAGRGVPGSPAAPPQRWAHSKPSKGLNLCRLQSLSLPSRLVSPGHTVVGYQFHYFRYCTWQGRIVFGEDLYVMPEFRGQGIGTSLLSQVAKLALARGCTQFRFMSANWNQPATALYEKLGAVDMTARDNWFVWHIEGQGEMAKRETQ